MQCRSCGATLVQNERYCPDCGTVVSNTPTDPSPYEQTVLSSSAAPPHTMYQNAHQAFNPYAVPLQPPPPPPQRRSAPRLALLVAVVVLLLVGSGIIYYANFSRPQLLSVQASVTAQVQQATATAFANTPAGLYKNTTSGKPVLNDPLSQNDLNQWTPIATAAYESCSFTGAAYHVTIQQKSDTEGCYAQATNFSNFAYQVEMTIVKGEYGGIFFRSDPVKHGEYDFIFTPSGNYYFLLTLIAPNTGKSNSTQLLYGTAPGFKTGLNQKNLITAIARGSRISLYVNQQYINSVTDNTVVSGFIGVRASEISQSTEVIFKNAQVWNA